MYNQLAKNPLVSVIITTYNRHQYLKEALNSIENQTYPFIEILVIDDGSDVEISNENRALCNLYSSCHYFYKSNTGQPSSRNYGINKSKGALIGFCDDDDLWALNKLEKQVGILQNKKEYSVVNCCIEYVKESGLQTGNIKCHEGFNQGYLFEHLLVKNRTASITPLLKREVFDKVGVFNKNFTIAEDWEFWRRVSYYFEFYNINEVLAYVRLHPNNMSKSRTGKPFEGYKLYRKLTKTLLNWGSDRFNSSDYNLIFKMEWQHYRRLMVNHYPGFFKKIKFLGHIFLTSINDGFHLIHLMWKYGR